MESWKPITLEALNLHIELTSHLLTEQEKSFWNFIRVEPRKWIRPDYGGQEVEFFVIAIFGERVIYYDDLEGGFNISKYQEFGKLIGDQSNQNEFHEYISNLFRSITSADLWW